jgi:tetratricopeptide (TPR) repeat protein
MNTSRFASAALLAVLLASITCGDHPASSDSNVNAFGDKLGTIHFEVPGKPEAQQHVVRGVKLLHHMMYYEADREFAAAIAADPDCTLAYWGRAMAIVHPLWPDAPSETELSQGWEWVMAGLAREPKTHREHAYLGTMETYFRDAKDRSLLERLQAVDEAWERVVQAYPEDLDAAAFSALFHLAPARFLPKDKSHRIQLTAGEILQQVLAKIPDHPGAQHYKIHAYDFPMLADRAVEVCDSYSSIAPDVPHALHMPTHIFTRRGQWDRSIEFNRRSAEAALKLSEKTGAMNSHYPHALDYMAYAYLQRGQYSQADAIRRQVLAMKATFETGSRGTMAFAFAAIPARCALERQDWTAAMALEPRVPESFPWVDQFAHCEAIVHFARTLGAIRSGELDTARRWLVEQAELNRRIAAANPVSYWASQAETQSLTTRAWLRLKEGDPEEALTLMRRAAEIEATTDKEAVTPGEVRPAGELLGDMLQGLGRHREALAAYEAMLRSSPNRLNSLFGAGRAAELANETAIAARYYAQLVALAAEADRGIEQLRHASLFVGNDSFGAVE